MQDTPGTTTDGMRVRRASLGYQLVVFGAMFILGAMLITILQQPADQMLNTAAELNQTQQAATGRGYTRQIWDWLPLWIGFLGLVQIVAGASLERGRVR